MYTGGIQRALINKLQVLASKKEMEIDIFLFSEEGKLSDGIPENINIIKSNYLLKLTATPFSEVLKKGTSLDKLLRIFLIIIVRVIGSKNLFNLLFLLQKRLCDYDVAISYFNDVPGGYFNKGCNQYVIEKVSAIKKIGWLHTDPIKAEFDREESLKTYQDFDSIVTVSKSGKGKLDTFIPEYKKKTSYVYNFFPIDSIREKANDYEVAYQENIINLVTVARIDNQSKRIDRIIEVVRMLRENNYIKFKWWIIGDGPDLASNVLLSERFGLKGFIEFIGEKSNPFPYIKQADVFVLSSDYEGYPMVVGEALALRTPVITTAYSSAEEQLINGVNGIIVSTDTKSLFEGIKSIFDDKEILINMNNYIKKNDVNNDLAIKQLNDLLN